MGQQGTTTRLWARRGARAWAPKDCRRLSAWLFGAVCPARGVGAGLVLPDANGPMMNLHLAEISRHVAPQAHAVLVLDKAKWHSFGPSLRLPDNITLLHLPSVSPELNPVEAIWAYLRSNTLSNRVFDTYDDIVSACSHAWNWLTSQPQRINSIASRSWARVHA